MAAHFVTLKGEPKPALHIVSMATGFNPDCCPNRDLDLDFRRDLSHIITFLSGRKRSSCQIPFNQIRTICKVIIS